MRRLLGAVITISLLCGLGACGGDDGDDVAIDIDPCELLDEDAAAELAGAEVERASSDDELTCTYRFSDEADAEGAEDDVAASLKIKATDEAPPAALEAEVAAAGEGETEDVDVGDAGATFKAAGQAKVVYAVPKATVTLSVAPASGSVDDVLLEAMVDFAATTVEPVKAALAGEDASGAVTSGEIVGLWTGDWGTMALREVGDEIHGAYTHDEGTVVGTFEDGVFVGWWSEIPSREPTNDAGEVEFRFTKGPDGITLDGRWRYGTEGEFSEDWDLTQSDEPIPPELEARFEDEPDAFVEHP